MSYDNAEPKALKFLVSNGDLVDESGNVIAHSDSFKDMYDKASPQVKKYLLSDGSVVDEDGNTIIKNDYFKKVYDQATPKVAKYLHADGTIDENAGGGSGGNVQNNKSVTITENGTTVINPDSGYDSIKKVTAEINVSGTSSGIDFTSKVWVYNKSDSDMFIALDSENKPLPVQSNIANFLTKCYAIIFPPRYDISPEYLYKDSEQYTPLSEHGEIMTMAFNPQSHNLTITSDGNTTTISNFDPTNFIEIPLINAMLLIND